MALDQFVLGLSWVMEYGHSGSSSQPLLVRTLSDPLFMIVMYTMMYLAMVTAFAVVCYKWEIDDIRRQIIEIGVPLHPSMTRPTKF